MALDESIDGLEKLESNGISAYVDAGLLKLLKNLGSITIDYITTPYGTSGYSVTVGDKNCSSGDCSCG